MKDDARGHGSASKDVNDFLLKKTDSGATESGAMAAGHTPIRTDSVFAEKAVHTVDGLPSFAALVIGIDPPQGQDPTPHRTDPTDPMDRIHGVVDACCREREGIWGILETGLYGCILPGLAAADALPLAEAIRDQVGREGPDSVSVGMAVFPQGKFHRHQILDNALKALDHAAFFGPGSVVAFDAVSLNISADKFYEKGDLTAAIEELQQALDLDPEDHNVHNSLGVCYGVLGAYEKALKIFETTASLVPDDAMAVYNAGLALMRMGDQKQALDRFLEADALEEAPGEAGIQIGRIYLDMKKPAKALPFLEKAARRKAESGIAHRYLGEALAALDRIEPSITAYKKAIRFNPHDAEALSALGWLFDRKGENPEISVLFCRQSIERMPDNGIFRERLGTVLLKQNLLQEALEEFFKAEELGRDVKGLIARTREQLTVEDP